MTLSSSDIVTIIEFDLRMGRYFEAIDFFKMMINRKNPISVEVYLSLLKICEHILDVTFAPFLFDTMPYETVMDPSIRERLFYIFSFLGNFEKLKELELISTTNKDSSSFTSTIINHIKSSKFKLALETFKIMITSKRFPSQDELHEIIQHCTSKSSAEVGDYVIKYVRKEFAYSTKIYNTMIEMYGATGRLHLAKKVYEEMKESNDFKPNHSTFGILLHQCGDFKQKEIGDYIMEEIKRLSLPVSIYICSGALYFYKETGRFDKMMQYYEQNPLRDKNVYIQLLNACGEEKDKISGSRVMKDVQTHYKNDFDHFDPPLVSSVFFYYYKTNQVDLAMKLFEKMIAKQIELDNRTLMHLMLVCANTKNKTHGDHIIKYIREKYQLIHNTVYNSMICYYGNFYDLENCRSIFDEMIEKDVPPDTFTCYRMLGAAKSANDVETGDYVVEYMKNKDIRKTVNIYNNMVKFYAKTDRLELAIDTIDDMANNKIPPTSVSCDNVLKRCLSNSLFEQADRLIEVMKRHDVLINKKLFVSMLIMYKQTRSIEKAVSLYDTMINQNIVPNDEAYALLLDICAESKDVTRADEFIKVIKEKEIKSASVFGSAIKMYLSTDRLASAVEYFHQMTNDSNTLLDTFVCVVLLRALTEADVTNKEECDFVVDYVQKNSISMNSSLYHAIINMYVKTGREDLATSTLMNMIEHEFTPNQRLFETMSKLYDDLGMEEKKNVLINVMG
ncbi:hypothetical protein AKO1_005311 [Acrasis kona]|uniref:Pentatricopeptide repeat-containing protein n=1 Tax=Acrasis kona TaxID=1008807 RepID=A0AAW2YM76_9EUKA